MYLSMQNIVYSYAKYLFLHDTSIELFPNQYIWYLEGCHMKHHQILAGQRLEVDADADGEGIGEWEEWG